MKKLATPFAAVLLAACSSNSAGPGLAIAVDNGDFERTADDGGIPGWFITQHAGTPAYDTRIDPEGAYRGHGSLRITRLRQQEYGSILQRIPVAGFAGKTIELSAMLKSRDVGPGGWKLYINGEVPRSLAFSPGLTGTRDWQRQSVRLKLTPQIHTVSLGAILIDAGSGWVDDVQLSVLDR